MRKALSAVAFATAFFALSGVAYAHHADELTIDCDSLSAKLFDFQSGTYTVTASGDVDGTPFTLAQQVTVAHGRPDTPITFNIADLTDAQGADITVTAHLTWQGKENGSSSDTTFTGPCGETPEIPPTTVQPPAPPVDEPVVQQPHYGGGDVAPPAVATPHVGGVASSIPATRAHVLPVRDELPRTGSNWLLATIGASALALGGLLFRFATRKNAHGYWESND